MTATPEETVLHRHLVVRADGTTRVVTRLSRLRLDEVAFDLTVRIPGSWGEVVGDIEVQMPEPPTADSHGLHVAVN